MQEHFPPDGSDAAPAERLPADRPLHHVVQAHPNDLVDPWWMNEVLVRGYGEILYKEWSLELDDVDHELLDDHLPDGVELVRRGMFLTSGRMEFVLEMGEALAAVALSGRRLWIGVAGRDLESARLILKTVEEAFPEPPESDAEEEPHITLAIWTHSIDSRSFRRVDVEPWRDVEANYAVATREQIAPLMRSGYRPDRGQLIVWHGAPGTGKSYALSALAYQWREWATFSYIADPDSLLGDSGYLLEWMTLRHPHKPYRVAILEDTGELFGADASKRTGQGLSRLLNATDGMLGKAQKTLFVITTNERIQNFHEAVIRPGRCVSRVEFERMPVRQARAWLRTRDAGDIAERVSQPATVAELFAMVQGDIEPPDATGGGMYL